MALSSDELINFDLIEEHKENIQQLKGGRSASQLARILSPRGTGPGNEVTLEETKTLNDAIRQEYEKELASIAEADDPLDIFDSKYTRQPESGSCAGSLTEMQDM